MYRQFHRNKSGFRSYRPSIVAQKALFSKKASISSRAITICEMDSRFNWSCALRLLDMWKQFVEYFWECCQIKNKISFQCCSSHLSEKKASFDSTKRKISLLMHHLAHDIVSLILKLGQVKPLLIDLCVHRRLCEGFGCFKTNYGDCGLVRKFSKRFVDALDVERKFFPSTKEQKKSASRIVKHYFP